MCVLTSGTKPFGIELLNQVTLSPLFIDKNSSTWEVVGSSRGWGPVERALGSANITKV